MPAIVPKGWIRVALGDVCLPVGTVRPEATPNAEFTYFDIGGIDGDTNSIVSSKTILGRNASSRARQVVTTNDILFATVRTYLRKIALIDREYHNPVASTGFAVIRAGPGVLPEFLFLQVLSDDFLQPLHALQTGSNYPAVREKDVFAQTILMPPTSEQERIVKKLSASLFRVAQGEKKVMQAREKMSDFHDSLLRDAVSGVLTANWRKKNNQHETGALLLKRVLAERRTRWDKNIGAAGKTIQGEKRHLPYKEPAMPETANLPAIPTNWVWASPEQLSDGGQHALSIGPFGSDLKVSDYRESGVPLIFVRSIRSENFVNANTKCISQGKADKLDAHRVVGGDLLITKMGDPPGDACMYPEGAMDAVITADCIRLRVSSSLQQSKMFVVYCINSLIGKLQIQKITRGIAQQKINLSHFASLALPLPPLEEQLEIVRQVEGNFSASKKLFIAVARQLAHARAEKQSSMRDAFSGKLVPYDSGDEHASMLLKRISDFKQSEFQRLKSERPKLKRVPKLKTIRSVEEFLTLLATFGGESNAEQLLLSAGLSDDVDTFYDILREGKRQGLLTVPTGESGNIVMNNYAN